ncbi:MAG: spsA [Rhodobacter sp. CACIA14H1]|nr:MAG: spsA [Rhodobacter sp. CACIA14H1]
MTLTVVILTKNEERHIARAMASVTSVSDRIVVVDSGSTDRTVELARQGGAEVLQHPFVTQAQQFNWALDQLPSDTKWVFRLDADEVVTEALASEIETELNGLSPVIGGVHIARRMTFLGRPIRWGGLFPIRVLRLFRHGHGRCENRWMDEHILVDGEIAEFKGEIVDDNRNSLTWWTEKHNLYASREVVDLLNLEYGFRERETVAALISGQQVGMKRWVKEKVYARLPVGVRAFMYFLYRYVLRLGFLDGREGTAFHVLQGFWYRYLVDMKLHEVKAYMRRTNTDVVTAIRDVLGIDVGR